MQILIYRNIQVARWIWLFKIIFLMQFLLCSGVVKFISKLIHLLTIHSSCCGATVREILRRLSWKPYSWIISILHAPLQQIICHMKSTLHSPKPRSFRSGTGTPCPNWYMSLKQEPKPLWWWWVSLSLGIIHWYIDNVSVISDICKIKWCNIDLSLEIYACNQWNNNKNVDCVAIQKVQFHRWWRKGH